MFFGVAKFIEVFNWFLFVYVKFFRLIFVICLIFCQLMLSNYLLVAISFEQDVEITFKIETTFFGCCVNFRKHVWIDALIDVLVSSEVFLEHSQVLFSLVYKPTYYFKYSGLTNIFTIQVNKILLFANVSIKFWRNTFSPEHIDHLVRKTDLNF